MPAWGEPTRNSSTTVGAPGERPVTTINEITVTGWNEAKLGASLSTMGYPKEAKPEDVNVPMLILLVFLQLIYVTLLGVVVYFVQSDVPVVPLAYPAPQWALSRDGLLGAGVSGLGIPRYAGLRWAP